MKIFFSSLNHPDKLWGSTKIFNGYMGPMQGGKAEGLEVDHLPPSSAEVKKKGR